MMCTRGVVRWDRLAYGLMRRGASRYQRIGASGVGLSWNYVVWQGSRDQAEIRITYVVR
jgi:hypothetical protein